MYKISEDTVKVHPAATCKLSSFVNGLAKCCDSWHLSFIHSLVDSFPAAHVRDC